MWRNTQGWAFGPNYRAHVTIAIHRELTVIESLDSSHQITHVNIAAVIEVDCQTRLSRLSRFLLRLVNGYLHYFS